MKTSEGPDFILLPREFLIVWLLQFDMQPTPSFLFLPKGLPCFDLIAIAKHEKTS